MKDYLVKMLFNDNGYIYGRTHIATGAQIFMWKTRMVWHKATTELLGTAPEVFPGTILVDMGRGTERLVHVEKIV